MIRKLPFLLLLLAAAAACACASSTWRAQAHVADAVGRIANTIALPSLRSVNQSQLVDVVDTAARTGKTRAQAQAAVDALVKRWDPVWGAWDALSVAEDIWASCIEHGGCQIRPTADKAHAEYCRLVRVSSNVGVMLPDFPAAPCALVKKGPGA